LCATGFDRRGAAPLIRAGTPSRRHVIFNVVALADPLDLPIFDLYQTTGWLE